MAGPASPRNPSRCIPSSPGARWISAARRRLPICCSSSPPSPPSPSSISSSFPSAGRAHERHAPPRFTSRFASLRNLPRAAAGQPLAGRGLPHLRPAGVLDGDRPLPPLLAGHHLLQAADRRRLPAEISALPGFPALAPCLALPLCPLLQRY